MGTNYYAVIDTCPHCGRGDKRVHIGKSSAGWSFSFHAVEAEVAEGWFPRAIASWADWHDALLQHGVTICNEYDEEITIEALRAMVESKLGGKNHTTYMRTEYGREGGMQARIAARMADECFLDPEGHSFSRGEFS